MCVVSYFLKHIKDYIRILKIAYSFGDKSRPKTHENLSYSEGNPGKRL